MQSDFGGARCLCQHDVERTELRAPWPQTAAGGGGEGGGVAADRSIGFGDGCGGKEVAGGQAWAAV